MIPADWRPYHRFDDGELLGYLAPTAEGLSTPMNVLGQLVDEPGDDWTCEQVLEQTGLSYLADTWLLRHDDGQEQRVVLLEVDAERVVVGDADSANVVGRPKRMGRRTQLPVPTDRLHRV